MENIFDKHCAEAQKFIKKLAAALGDPQDIHQALRLTRAVFRTLRTRILPEESMHIIAQLPVVLKGIYVDGWNMLEPVSPSRTLEEFMDELREEDTAAGYDLPEANAKEKVKCVLESLRQYISDGEFRHILTELPLEIAQVLT
jgi:uncharacterized protein (DUF2267 family)